MDDHDRFDHYAGLLREIRSAQMDDHDRGLDHYVSLLREIISVIMALAFANAITQAVVMPGTGGARLRFSLCGVLLFSALITTIVRFYHGNMRYLVQEYLDETKRPGTSGIIADYIFLVFQSLVFSAATFYQFEFAVFHVLFLVLFFTDAAWWFFVWRRIRSRLSETDAQVNWMVTNLLTSAVLLGLFMVEDEPVAICLFCGVVAANMVVDYWINWRYYFPSRPPEPRRVFLSAPFTGKLRRRDDGGQEIAAEHRDVLEGVMHLVRSLGLEVDCSHREEKWGREISGEEECTRRDWTAIRDDQMLIALVDSPPSGGVHIELGWASALGKPVIIAASNGTELSPLARGLGGMMPKKSLFDVFTYDTESSLHEQLRRTVTEMLDIH
jgi:hypothetical protein